MAASADAAPFRRLDFVYMPSRDVPADKAFFTDALGGRLVSPSTKAARRWR